MDERHEWKRNLFQALTSKRLSRNKYFAKFSDHWFRAVHKRYRVVASLKAEAGRLGAIPGTNCWISRDEHGLHFHLHSPRMNYRRVVALQSYEWEWLIEQSEIQSLFRSGPQQALLQG
jgi:hypothetical protein